jgi:hypothetical protein
MSHSEWELLANSEDIEPGDWVSVENEDGSTQKLQYIKQKSGYVILRDRKGELFKFSADSLEESGGERIITGKA